MSMQDYQTFRTRNGHEARVYGTKTIGEAPILYGTIIKGIKKTDRGRVDCWGAWHTDGRDIQDMEKFDLVMKTKR